MNLDTKMGLMGDKRQLIELTKRFHTNFVSSLEEAKRNNNEIVQINSQRI